MGRYATAYRKQTVQDGSADAKLLLKRQDAMLLINKEPLATKGSLQGKLDGT